MSIIGIDVSKAKLDTLWIRDLEAMKVKSKAQPNTPKGHQALVDWAMAALLVIINSFRGWAG